MTGEKITILNKFPVINLAAANMVFPNVISHVFLRSPSGMGILEEAMNGKCPYIFAVMAKPDVQEIPDRWHEAGVVASLEIIQEDFSVLLTGLYRAKAVSWGRNTISDDQAGYWTAKTEKLEDIKTEYFIEESGKLKVHPKKKLFFRAAFYNLKKLVEKFVEVSGEDEAGAIGAILDNFENYDFNTKLSMDQLIWALLSVIPEANASEKQEILSATNIIDRISGVKRLLAESIFMLQLKDRIDSNPLKPTAADMGQPNNIKSGSLDNLTNKDNDFIRGAHPELIEKYKKYLEIRESVKDSTEKATLEEAAMKDFNRLRTFKRASSDVTEVAMLNTHLDFILSLPWGKESPRKDDFKEFEKVFESEHFGLEKVKDEISDHVAVRQKRPDGKGRVLCFIGPPGVGKTSVCKSIAKGQGLEYIRISLGGIRDEAEIRGHRRTYIGALPGRIMAGLKRAGAKNPVFVLDEIDKIGHDLRGDPADALLEVLDPEQNYSFSDHYLEAPFDLSKVFFICTANTVSGIPVALRDRMDKIYFSGYTEEEKVQIAKNFLVPKVLAEVGLDQGGFSLNWHNDNPDEVLLKIIRGYTKEAGVRDIERKLLKIVRKIVKEDIKDPGYANRVVITEELVEKVHGRPKYDKGRAKETERGEAIGLLVDEVGTGDITYVQAKLSIKTGPEKSISQTDEAGESLYKSTQRAVTVAKGKLESTASIVKKLKTHLINIQVSDSFTPTDGPSAGVTVVVAIISELTHQLVKPYVAMTGAISLTGRIKGVGGIKEKVIAAANAGVREVILPESNKKDYDEEVPRSAKLKLNRVHFVENVDQVLEIVFEKTNPA